MTLTDEQKAAVAEWVRDGAGLSDVQKRLQSEFDISMTYMDVRFLVIDLELTLQQPGLRRPGSGGCTPVRFGQVSAGQHYVRIG